MDKIFAISLSIIMNLISLPAFAQAYAYAQANDRPWVDKSSSRTTRNALPSTWNVYSAPGFSGASANTALLAGQSVNPAPIRSGKFNLGFGGPNAAPHDLPGPDDGSQTGAGTDQQTVELPYTPGPDWAPVINSHSGALMGYMAPGETLQQFFSGQSGHILPSQAAEGQWILQNQLGDMGGETAAEFSGF